MKKIINSLTYKDSKESYQRFTEPSLTMQDQSLTVREILERHARGIPTTLKDYTDRSEPSDPNDFDYMPDPRHMDLADREAFAREAVEIIKGVKEKQSKKNIPNAPGGAGGSAPAMENPGDPNGDVGGGSRPTANAAGTN